MLKKYSFHIIVGILEVISSVLGGIISNFLNINSKKLKSNIYNITSGVMLGITFLSILPELLKVTRVSYGLIIILVSIFIIMFLEKVVDNKLVSINNKVSTKTIIIILTLAVHNAVEGFIAGTSVEYSFKLAITIVIALFLHNIPEGMIVGLKLKESNRGLKEIIKICILVAIPAGIGSLIGAFLIKTSSFFTPIGLGFCAGAMIYIVLWDLVPQSKSLGYFKHGYISYLIGIIISYVIIKI